MKVELQEVRLSKLDPNPFRDGSGGTPPATWESVAEAYGFDAKKLEELQKSYQTNGVWAGVHVRQAGGRFQVVFGHHRVEAARRLGLEAIQVIVGEYDADKMVKMMASENSEEYGHDFALGVMNAVEAVVKAYGAGLVELEKPGETTKNAWYDAPSFVLHGTADRQYSRPYTATSVGRYLGWVQRDNEKVQGSLRVRTALAALELIEKGVLKRSQLKGLSISDVQVTIQGIKSRMRLAESEVESTVKVVEEAAIRAEKAGDERKAAAERARITEMEASVAQTVKRAGASAASEITSRLETEPAAAVARDIITKGREEGDKRITRETRKDEPKTASEIDGYAAGMDRIGLDGPTWDAYLKGAGRAKRAGGLLAEAMDRASKRLAARAKELKGVL